MHLKHLYPDPALNESNSLSVAFGAGSFRFVYISRPSDYFNTHITMFMHIDSKHQPRKWKHCDLLCVSCDIGFRSNEANKEPKYLFLYVWMDWKICLCFGVRTMGHHQGLANDWTWQATHKISVWPSKRRYGGDRIIADCLRDVNKYPNVFRKQMKICFYSLPPSQGYTASILPICPVSFVFVVVFFFCTIINVGSSSFIS